MSAGNGSRSAPEARSALQQRSAAPAAHTPVDAFTRLGLFVVPLDGLLPEPVDAGTAARRPDTQLGGAREAAIHRDEGRRYRFCSGCSRVTEHVVWASEGQGSIPAIRWPSVEPPSGATICLDCGQWLAG